jgi:hypothetical protein
LFSTILSGGFVCLIQMVDRVTEYEITPELLTRPNNIGPYPQPTQSMIIPVDSLGVLVGSGSAPNGNMITREQYWKRAADSYALALNQKMEVTYSVTSGTDRTSSSDATIAASIDVEASAEAEGRYVAGPGVISARVSTTLSASLNTSSTWHQQVMTSVETTRTESMELTNTTDEPQMYLKWQLVDVITVFDAQAQDHGAMASLMSLQTPVLIAGPYNPDDLAEVEPSPVVTPEVLEHRPTV